MRSSRSLDRVGVVFDDDNLVANAGLIVPATLAQHLGLEGLINAKVRLTDSSAGFRPGREALTLVHSMIAGGDSIDDADVLRAGSSAAVLGHVVMATRARRNLTDQRRSLTDTKAQPTAPVPPTAPSAKARAPLTPQRRPTHPRLKERRSPTPIPRHLVMRTRLRRRNPPVRKPPHRWIRRVVVLRFPGLRSRSHRAASP